MTCSCGKVDKEPSNFRGDLPVIYSCGKLGKVHSDFKG